MSKIKQLKSSVGVLHIFLYPDRGGLLMAKFTDSQWTSVFDLLETDGVRFGLPERRDDSVVLASFNIRKIGKVKNRSKQSWEFLKAFCSRCDLLAIQEVLDNLEGLNYLKGLLGDGYGMVASDTTGKVPGGSGMAERLAFLFNWSLVNRTEIASDITYDRSVVMDTLFDKRDDFTQAFVDHQSVLDKWENDYAAKIQNWNNAGQPGKKPKKPSKPAMVLPHFVTFIRTPLCVSFRIPGFEGAVPYEFLAVNAHLLYGDKTKQKEEREMEFLALMEWLIGRAKQMENLYHKNLILLGDLNLDFEKTDQRRDFINAKIKDINKTKLKSKKAAQVNFPFLDVHSASSTSDVFRTNARMDQTYDQIALFIRDKRLPNHNSNDTAGNVPGEFDYGMFNFVELFAEAIHGAAFKTLSKSNQKNLIKKFEYDVSDHMPIWIRLVRPYVGQSNSQ